MMRSSRLSTWKSAMRRRSLALSTYGLIRLFLIVATNGDKEYWATNDLHMTALTRVRFAGYSWTIEQYHQGIKQFCGVERAQVRGPVGAKLQFDDI